MALKKIVVGNDLVRWEVNFYESGRGSKRSVRRFETRRDAEEFLDHLKKLRKETQYRNDGMESFQETTFNVETEYWVANRGLVMSPSSKKRAGEILKTELLPRFGSLNPLHINSARLAEFQNTILRRGCKPRTVNRIVSILRAILNYSMEQQRIPFNPTARFKNLRGIDTHATFWEAKEASAFLRYAELRYPRGSTERWIYLVYLLALNTGLRSGEIWGLQAQDLMRNGELLHIRRQFDYVSKSLRDCKGKDERYVPCNSLLRDELLRWIECKKLSGRDLVFQGRTSSPIDDHSFKRHFFIKDMKRCHLRPVRFHDLRHTAATLMIANGIDLPTVQAVLGHKDIATTMRYVHLLGESIQRVAQIFRVAPANEESPSRSYLRLVK